ncbi:hypothetical protein GQ54DRAFT_181759 [Martensiomyces pterosporus]|nr:hypothetical protein GQ54DRAFT_181759 [Martensiomyces pterosporus]
MSSNKSQSPFEHGGLSQDPRYDPDSLHYGGYRHESGASEYHVPLPSYHLNHNKSQSPFEHGGLSQDPRYDPDSLHYGGYRHESGASEYHVPLPSYHLNQQPFSHSTGELAALNRQATRGRSESDGYRSMSARSSEDRAPLTTFFGTQAWQRLSTNLPSGVRDPLNIDELEREERLMMPPYGRQGGLSAPAIQPVSSMPTNAASRSHLNSSMYGSQPYQSSSGHATGEKQGSRHISEISTSFLNSNAGGSNGVPMLSEKTGSSGSALPAPPLDWAYIQDHNLRNGGLPSLDQVLTRRTRAPLALRDFAVHCSVRQPQARRWLEFYMAARTHEKMCLAYESDLRHAKARSHYASADSRILPDRFNSGLPGSLSGAIAGEKEKHRSSKYTHKSDIHELSDAQKRAAAHTATIESLSRGRATTEPPGDDPLLYPEDDIQATPQPPQSQGGAKSGFHRSHRQSTRMALQIQTAAETIFLRYFRAALDPNLLQGGSPSYWPTNMMPKVHGGIGGAHDDSGKMGSLKRMLTQRAAGAGGPRSKNPKGLHLAQNTLRPTFDDPYHQGYGVAATDSVYVSRRGHE